MLKINLDKLTWQIEIRISLIVIAKEVESLVANLITFSGFARWYEAIARKPVFILV